MCYATWMAKIQDETVMAPRPAELIGTWRRFGVLEPVYEIISARGDLPNGDRLTRVRVVETGEELDHHLGEIMDDPIT